MLTVGRGTLGRVCKINLVTGVVVRIGVEDVPLHPPVGRIAEPGVSVDAGPRLYASERVKGTTLFPAVAGRKRTPRRSVVRDTSNHVHLTPVVHPDGPHKWPFENGPRLFQRGHSLDEEGLGKKHSGLFVTPKALHSAETGNGLKTGPEGCEELLGSDKFCMASIRSWWY